MVDFTRLGGIFGRAFGGTEEVDWHPSGGGVVPLLSAVVTRGASLVLDGIDGLEAATIGADGETITVDVPSEDVPAIAEGEIVTIAGKAHRIARRPVASPDGMTRLGLREDPDASP